MTDCGTSVADAGAKGATNPMATKRAMVNEGTSSLAGATMHLGTSDDGG